ncbi:MAG: cytochrome c [candidate division WOR-3 bacterium]
MKTKILSIIIFIVACSNSKVEKPQNEKTENNVVSDIGIGPIKKVEISENIDMKLVEEGKKVFELKCTACHKLEERYVGPALKGITKRRKPEWIMNMILNPIEMTQKDPIAKQLLSEYLTQMTYQDIKENEARAILEYFRYIDREGK